MNREKIEFAANIPTAVILDGLGTEQASKNGTPEIRYFCAENRIMWVPPEVADQIADMQDAQGAQNIGIVITRSQAKRGAPVAWKVESQAAHIAAHAGNGYSNSPSPVNGSGNPPLRMSNASSRPNNNTSPARQPQPAAPAAAELPITAADRMAAALRDAIELARGAQQYEPAIVWSAGDIRALAATLFIEQCRGGSR